MDVTDATFQAEVIERSALTPVVVDLWAPWCGPCRQLGPLLEKVVAATDGRVVLAKVNVDENPAVSGQFRVQSIPAVYAVRDRKVVDGFMGAVPEPQVQAFVDKLLPTEQDSEVERLLAAGDEQSLRRALELAPAAASVVCALAELLIAAERPEEALDLLGRIPADAETRRLAALARTGGVVDDVESKLEHLLGRVKADDTARQEYLDLLELMGPGDPRTATYRRRLTSQLH